MKYRKYLILCSTILFCLGCKKLATVDAPVTKVNGELVFSDNKLSIAAVTGLYGKMAEFSRTDDIMIPAVSSDEFILHFLGGYQGLTDYYQNNLNAETSQLTSAYDLPYTIIYLANNAIEGLNASRTLSPTVKQQLLGEAKFIRAYQYFYLLNFFGDVPLALTTDYKTNARLSRSPKKLVLDQVVTDLKEAQSLLNQKFVKEDVITPYSTGQEERVRPSTWAATALLARAYLYQADYSKAAIESSKLIDNTVDFKLTGIDDAFLKNNTEAIWQLQPIGYAENTRQAIGLVIPSTGPSNDTPLSLSKSLIASFEQGDLRKTNWIKHDKIGNDDIYSAYKYKVYERDKPLTEYFTILRLAEQYLIRAEARIMAGNIPDGIADLNIIRARARDNSGAFSDPLPALSTSLTKEQAFDAVIQERRVELFTEGGHRWLDLKRTGLVDAVMTAATAVKGGTWDTRKQLYPIPQKQRDMSSALTQNPGY